MNRLRQRYLNVPLDAVLHPVSAAVRHVAKEQQHAAVAAPTVPKPQSPARVFLCHASGDKQMVRHLYGDISRGTGLHRGWTK